MGDSLILVWRCDFFDFGGKIRFFMFSRESTIFGLENKIFSFDGKRDFLISVGKYNFPVLARERDFTSLAGNDILQFWWENTILRFWRKRDFTVLEKKHVL